MRPVQVLAAVAGLATISSAWSGSGIWEDSAEKAVQGIEAVERIFRRQNDASSTTAQTTAKITGTVKTTTTAQNTATGSNTATGTGSQKATGSITGSAKGTAKASGTAAATTEYDARLPAGGVSMITPGVFDGAQYYRVGDYVTFAWNFTSVLATPTAVNVLASCSANSVEYTLLANATFPDDQKMTYVWDTNQVAAQATAPQLIMGKYTLVIENANQALATGGPSAGYLGSVAQYTFGMYTPQPYTPWADYNCPTCKSGMSRTEQQTVFFLLGMGSITILSFTWFATGRFGVL